jgi:magnesium-transporting ATPase (P-type)
METNDLQNLWKSLDSEISLKSISELNQSLTTKTRKTINKYLFILATDIIVCVGLMIFLVFTAINRQEDIIYLLNNSALFSITAVSLVVSVFTLKKLQNNKYNLPLKEWLEQRIKMLSRWLSGKYSKLYIVLIPILLVLINLSIHVYYEYKPFLEVMKNQESMYGLLFGFIIGLFVAFYAVGKIRKYQLKNLEILKDLHTRLCDVC